MKTTDTDNAGGRRKFLGLLGGGLMILKPATAFGSEANSAVEIGIVGCGGRGEYVGGLFMEFTGARIVALADPFQDRMDAVSAKLKLSAPRAYGGLTGYRELVQSKVDGVVVTSPPYFHPEHAEAAVASNKHVYCAKPVAVDVPGCRRIQAAADKAGKKLSVWVDWQTRVSPAFVEVQKRIAAGDIGRRVMGMATFHGSGGQRKDTPGMKPAEALLRNWLFDRALSGNLMVEQSLHSLDVLNWYLGAHPVRAFGTGGKRVRTWGDCWDQFFTTLWYPDNVEAEYGGSQFVKGGGGIDTRVFGTEGTSLTQYNGPLSIVGQKPWAGIEKDKTMGFTAENTKIFVASLREAKPVNNMATSVQSTLSAILARVAAERQQIVTWDELMRSTEKLEPAIKL